MTEEYPPIQELIPHKPPMILVDRIIEMSAEHVRAESDLPLVILKDRMMCGASAWTLEIAAQTCAALIGHEYRDKDYRQGRLIKSPRWRLARTDLPTEGNLQTGAKLEAASEMGVFLFAAQVTHNGQTLAEGQLTILAQ